MKKSNKAKKTKVKDAKNKPKGTRPFKTEEDPKVLHEWTIFVQNVRYLRERRNLTQQQLADALGWHRTTINRLENNHHQPFWGQACVLCDFMKVGVAEMRAIMEHRGGLQN